MAHSEETVWRAAGLRWRSWNQEWIVYHTASGNTHLLTSVAAEALRMLERNPANATDLSRKLAASMSLIPDEELIDQVGKLVANLEGLGLIEPVTQFRDQESEVNNSQSVIRGRSPKSPTGV